jgi:hypothetical protein
MCVVGGVTREARVDAVNVSARPAAGTAYRRPGPLQVGESIGNFLKT